MPLVTLEEHSSVLSEWWSRQLRAQTLVCLDAHLDLQAVGSERMGSLESCTTVEAVKCLEKAHHLLPDRGFSYSLEDFLYPAHRLGLIDRLVWVAPPHVEAAPPEAVLDQLRQMDGARFEELVSFRRTSGGWIEGRLLGLDITICSYLQLESVPLPGNALLDIDTDYFVTVPGDEAWIDPRAVFEVLDRLPVVPELVTLSYSVGSGFTPVRYRFLTEYLLALWEGRSDDSDHYSRLFGLDQCLQEGRTAPFLTGCREELARYPECAATHYLLSLGEPDPTEAEDHRGQAADLCGYYGEDALRTACGIRNRQLAVDSVAVAELENQLWAVKDRPDDRALAHAALGLIYCAGSQADGALLHYERYAEHLGAHPELALEIAKLMLQSGQAGRAEPYLEAALGDDATRTAAHFYQGYLYAEQGEPERALSHLETAHEAAPAWGEIATALAETHQHLGDLDRSRALRDECSRQEQQATELLMRLGGSSHLGA